MIIKGNIYSGGKYYRYLKAENGIVSEVSDSAPGKPDMDFTGSYVYPGFIDSHTHLYWYGLNLIRCNLTGVRSTDEIYERLAIYSSDFRGEYIIAEGFDETVFKRQNLPEKAVLDRMFPDIPVVVRRMCGHIAVLNENAYRVLKKGLTIYDPKTGAAREGSILALNDYMKPAPEETMRAAHAAEESFFSHGITSAGDMSTHDSLKLYRDKKFKIDIRFFYPYAFASDLKEWTNNKKVSLAGLKVFTDGSIGGYTAAISGRYKGAPGSGELLVDRKEIKKIRNYAEKRGYMVAAHAIGDRAIEEALAGLKGGLHRIEHFELADKKQVKEAAESGLYVSMQPNFIGNWSMKNQMYERRLPLKMFKFNNTAGYNFKSGIEMGFGSDCMPVSPLYGIKSLVNAMFEEQKLDAKTALNLYTAGSALICGFEKKGSLEKGYAADAVVLNRRIDDYEKGKNIEILFTVKNGNIVFKKE